MAPPGVQDLGGVLRHEPGELLGREASGLRAVDDRLRTERAVVGEDELHVAAEAQGAKDPQAPDRRQVAGLEAEAVLVEALDRRVRDRGAANRSLAAGPLFTTRAG